MTATVVRAAGTLGIALVVGALGPSGAYGQTPAPAQQSSQSTASAQAGWIAVTEISVKPEMMREFQSLMKETMGAMRQGGARQVDVWQTTAAAGSPFDYIVAVRLDNLASFDSPGFLEKGLGASAFAEWQAKAGRHVASVRRYILRLRPDMTAAPSTAGQPKMAVVTWTTVAPGRGGDYENWVKNEYLPVLKQAQGASYRVAQVLFGGDANRYVSLTLRENFAELEKGPLAVQVLGAEGNQKLMQKIPAGAVVQVERTLVRFVPELSISPTGSTAGR